MRRILPTFIACCIVIVPSVAFSERNLMGEDPRSLALERQEAELQNETLINCEVVTQATRFCAYLSTWKRTFADPGTTAQFISTMEVASGLNYNGKIIVEAKDESAALGVKALRDRMLNNVLSVATSMGGTVELLAEENRTVLEHNSDLLAYKVDSKGIPLMFVNSILETNYEIIQIITWRIGSKLGQIDYDAHMDFVGKVRFYQ